MLGRTGVLSLVVGAALCSPASASLISDPALGRSSLRCRDGDALRRGLQHSNVRRRWDRRLGDCLGPEDSR